MAQSSPAAACRTTRFSPLVVLTREAGKRQRSARKLSEKNAGGGSRLLTSRVPVTRKKAPPTPRASTANPANAFPARTDRMWASDGRRRGAGWSGGGGRGSDQRPCRASRR